MTTAEILVRYVTLPDELEAALAGLAEADFDLARSPGAWTIRQTVHHIVDADEVTKLIIKAALGNSGCTFGLEWYDLKNSWVTIMNYASRPIAPALALFRANHRDLELLLQQLPEAWERYVMLKREANSELRKVTVGQLIQTQTSHAEHHLEQIRATRQAHGR
ncbi:MAG: DinB family protein [candidate division KSB1 bacterium]|nr:DinB family protein [candidate division KSB1 bacterium]MDZ7302671.1 DinB family protein [candidate division KSB1 bacterium]MDZ7311799.1 DinB family protein [candidate division KSB1 bacterium]